MTKKPDRLAEVEAAEDEDVATEIGFTPEEEAALDAAAKTADKPAADKKPAAETTTDPEETVETLKQKLAEANTARESAEAKSTALEQKHVASVDELETGEQTRIKQADDKIAADIELADRDVKDLTRQLREAKENGELDKEMELTEKYSRATYKRLQLDGAKEGFDKWKGQRKTFWDAERKKAEKRVQTAGAAEEFNADDYSTEAKQWIDKNPQFKTDKKFRSRATAAHYDAEAEGIKADSPEYFKFIDKRLKGAADPAQDEEGDPISEANETVRTPDKKPAVVVKKKVQTQLPPSRESGTQRQSNDGRIKKLTAAEREAAEISGMSNEDYWDEKYGNQS